MSEILCPQCFRELLVLGMNGIWPPRYEALADVKPMVYVDIDIHGHGSDDGEDDDGSADGDDYNYYVR